MITDERLIEILSCKDPVTKELVASLLDCKRRFEIIQKTVPEVARWMDIEGMRNSAPHHPLLKLLDAIKAVDS